jgi:RNA 2',3'-cyclic 3'-phosphodiesterase
VSSLQPSFDGVAGQPSSTDRLFFALRPDAAAIVRIEKLVSDLQGDFGLKGKPLGAARFHVTLHFVGDFPCFPREVADAAVRAAQSVAAMPPFQLGFDRVGSFTRKARNMPLVLLGEDGLERVRTLQQALVDALTGHRDGHYTPHLTLLYDDRHVAARPIEPITWTARDFVLVRSLIGQSRHEVLARLPLRG